MNNSHKQHVHLYAVFYLCQYTTSSIILQVYTQNIHKFNLQGRYMTQQNLILECIRSRGKLGSPRVSLRKLLKENEMEDYIKLCFNRIMNERLIDHEAVTYQYDDPYDLLFNIEGMVICNDILKGYIDEEILNYCKKMLLKTDDTLKLIQEEAQVLRETPRWILLSVAKGYNLADANDKTMEKMQLLAREELKARRISSIISRKVSSALSKIHTFWHYRKLFLITLLRPDLVDEINSRTR